MFGPLSTSALVIALSFNTLSTVVWGIKPSRYTIRGAVIFAWVFSVSVALVGFATNARSLNESDSRFYARSVSVCYLNHRYIPTYGLGLQNVWVLLAVTITVFCYAWILVALVRNKQWPRPVPSPQTRSRKNAPPEICGHHPAFLVYPVIFFVTTVPLLLVGLLSLTGDNVSIDYFNWVFPISALAGLLDAVLWSTTILMSSSKELQEAGLAKFEFMRHSDRVYGYFVWVEGASGRSQGEGAQREGKHGHEWWRLHSCGKGSSDSSRDPVVAHIREPLSDGIHLDMVTSVKVDYRPSASTDGAPTWSDGIISHSF